MRILHLAFEDHRRPGAGGGSHRNWEVNRRLAAAGHDVEVVTAAYPYARPRVEEGVRYRHIGDGHGYFRSILSYHACLVPTALAVRRYAVKPDVVVEEFAPPWSSLGASRLTGISNIGMVQGYFAAEKAAEYRVPKGLLVGIEKFGTRRHPQLIALSGDLAGRLEAAAPKSIVHRIGMGLDQEEIARALGSGVDKVQGRIVFLGRLEVAQKGLDLLLQCVDLLEPAGAHLLLAGDGRDQRAVAERVRECGAQDRVTLLGRVDGDEKWRLLASAQVCVVPSRYETFGLSALESLACGTPVVGFEIPCLRETVPRQAGQLVTPFDLREFRQALAELLADPGRCAEMGRAGRAYAASFSWGAVADATLSVYRGAIQDGASAAMA